MLQTQETIVTLSLSEYSELRHTINILERQKALLEHQLRQQRNIIDAIILPLRNGGYLE